MTKSGRLAKYVIIFLLFILLLIPNVSAYTQEQITNGEFTSSMTGWTAGTANYGSGGSASVSYQSSGGQSGGYVRMIADGGSDTYANIQFYQTSVDLTGVSTLTYYVYHSSYYTGTGQNRFRVYIDGSNVYESTGRYTEWTYKTLDVSAYSGTHTIAFYTSASSGSSNTLGVDTVSAIGTYTDPVINSITASPSSGEGPVTISFTSSVTPGSPGTNYYIWEWGDGTAVGTTANANHEYAQVASDTIYNVTFRTYTSYTDEPYPSETIDVTITAPAGDSIAFDKSNYLSSETAVATTHLLNPDFGNYTYKILLYDLTTAELTDEFAVTSEDDTTEIVVSDYDPGTYGAYLYRYSAGIPTLLVEDPATAVFSYTVGYYGYVFNAETGSGAPSVPLTLSQSGNNYPNTTGSSGEYQVTGLSVNQPVSFSISTAGYEAESFTITPLNTYNYNINISLLPTSPSHSGTAIAGVVLDYDTHQPISGANVSLSGATTSSTTSSATGYYIFDSINVGEHTVNATKDDKTSDDYSVTTTSGTVQLQKIYVRQGYTVLVRVLNSDGIYTEGASVSLVIGGTAAHTGTTDANGNVTFTTVEYGTYSLIASYSGEEAQETVTIDDDKTITIQLASGTSSGAGVQYAPHYVKFVVKTYLGNPVSGATISAQPLSTTSGSNWIEDWLGISSEVDVTGTTMEGTTGADGSTTFMMIQTIKYRITVSQGGETLTTMDITPGDTEYTIYVGSTNPWYESGESELDVIRISVTKEEIDDDNARIWIDYNDTNAATTSVFINLTLSDEVIQNFTASSQSSINTSFQVEDYSGQTYIVDLTAENTQFGTLEHQYRVSFGGRLIEIPFLPEWAYIWVCVAIIMITGMIFGASATEECALLICIQSGLMLGAGWFNDYFWQVTIMLPFAFILAIALNIRKSHRRRGV